jgi:hypothetical protein
LASRRIPSCIGFDEENLEWLRKREEGMAEFLNTLVKDYRIKKPDETEPEQDPETGVVSTIIVDREKQKQDDEVKIHAFFQDSPHIVYMAKTQRKFKRADICRIKEELFFSKYNVDATVSEIRKILKEEMSEFNVENYEKERGILKKVE